MGTELKFKNGSYIKVIESNEIKRPTDIKFKEITENRRDELEIVKEAIRMLKFVDKWNDIPLMTTDMWNKKERLIESDEDCADCLCRVYARNDCNDSYNAQLEDGYANCSCNCKIGDILIETEDDCPQFLPDED